MNLTDALQQLFTDLQDIAQLIAPIAAFIGLLMSSLPVVSPRSSPSPSKTVEAIRKID